MSGPLHSLWLRALRQMRFRLLIQFPDAELYIALRSIMSDD